jgi:uncharacterized damage-inducible protein DinB
MQVSRNSGSILKAVELKPFYDGWADQQRKLLETLSPLTPEQMQLRPAPSEWAIWQLASNMAGGRLYWLCYMLQEDRRGVSGWKEDHPLNAGELVDALSGTWNVVEACLDRWSLADLSKEVTRKDLRGELRTITPGWVINRLMSHEFHHGSEIALILRMHGLPTSIAG